MRPSSRKVHPDYSCNQISSSSATAAVDVHGAMSSGATKVHLPSLASSRRSSPSQSTHTLPVLAPPPAANDPFAPLPLPKPPRPPMMSSRSSAEGSAKRLAPLGTTMPPQRQFERPDRHLSPLHDIQPESSLTKAPMAPIRPAQQLVLAAMSAVQAETVLPDASNGSRGPERTTDLPSSQGLPSKASLNSESSSSEAVVALSSSAAASTVRVPACPSAPAAAMAAARQHGVATAAASGMAAREDLSACATGAASAAAPSASPSAAPPLLPVRSSPAVRIAQESVKSTQGQERRLARVFVTTWNMHGNDPPADLHPWLPSDASRFDLYAIGTQEAERSIEMSILISSKAKWESRLRATLGEDFEEVTSHTLAAIHLIVLARRPLLGQISSVRSASVATGILNTVGNKGGVGISMQLGTTSLLFVNSHLSAHQHAVAERNADAARINSQLALRPSAPFAAAPNDAAARFDAVVWMGDLNYRIDGNRAVVDSLLAPADEKAKAADDWMGSEAHWDSMRAVLLANDQLRRQMMAGEAFQGFTEGPITFRPTYKFDTDAEEDVYDTSEKRRIPAYTDRVLFRCSDADALRLLRYDSCPQIRTSDHKPVVAEMELLFWPSADSPRWQRNSRRSVATAVTSSICSVM